MGFLVLIQQIHIHRFILSCDTVLHPGKGFNVFSGETGAGKTLLINALRFGIGDTLRKDLHYRTEDKPHVQITFFVPDFLRGSLETFPFSESEWVCERFVTPSGKNRTLINGINVSLKEYKKKLKQLLAIHGQHDTSHLFSKRIQLSLFDRYFHQEFHSHLKIIQDLRPQWIETKEKLKNWELKEKERQNEIDFLSYQIDEIEKAQLKTDEEEALIHERDLMTNSQHIIEYLQKIKDLFHPPYADIKSPLQVISESTQMLSEIQNFTSVLNQSHDSFQTCHSVLMDLLHDLDQEQEKISLQYDLPRLDAVISRIDQIQHLKRKYGKSISEILTTRQQFEIKLHSLEQEITDQSSLKKQLIELEESLKHHATLLSQKRHELSPAFEQAIKKELSALGMEKIEFNIRLESEERDSVNSIDIDNKNYVLQETGIDDINYLISTNPGQDLLPLSKIASGGELSRIMLAIQSMLGKSDQISTLIFDEIDTGIGGQIGIKLGQKLKELSEHHQVICITHLPQIAAQSDVHFKINKSSTDLKTNIFAQELDKNERIAEISRMICGDQASEISKQHATEMMSLLNNEN